MEKKKEINDWKIIVALMLLQLAVTLPFINSHAVALDEPFSIFYAQQELSEFIPFLNQGNNPPLHFIVLHYWIKMFGIGATSVRSLSLLFSVLTIPLLYQFGRKIMEQKYAVLLIGFFVFSTFNHFHALEARVYSLMVLLFVLVIYKIYDLLFSDKSVILQLAIGNVLLLYSHYLAGLIIGIEIILLVVFYKSLNRKKVIQFVLSGLISIVLYFPGLVQFYKRLGDFSENGTWVSSPHITELYGNIIRFFNYTISFFVLVGLVLIFSFLTRKTILNRLKNGFLSNKETFIFLCFALPYFSMYLFSILFQPIFLDRYLLFTTPFLFFSYIIIVRFVLVDFKNQYLPVLFIIPMIISCYYIPQTNRNGDELATFVKQNSTEKASIEICPPFYDLTFMYHFDKKLFSDYKNIELNKSIQQINSIYSFEDIHLQPGTKQLFYISANSEFLFPNNTILEGLNANFEYIQEANFDGDYKVYQYNINDQ